MLISKTVQDFLSSRRIPFRRLLQNNAVDGIAVPPYERVRVVLLCDSSGPILAAFPSNNGLDFETLVSITGRPLKVASAREFGSRLHGFSNLHLPPLGDLFGIDMILDESLLAEPWLQIAGGEDGVTYLLSNASFRRLVERANVHLISRRVQPFDVSKQDSISNSSVYQLLGKVAMGGTEAVSPTSDAEMVRRLKTVKLPPMPASAQRLAALKAADDFELPELVHAIELDPAISANILRFARSAFFAYNGRITSIKDAIFHVLGVDLALNAAFGIAVGGGFKGPLDGPLGLRAHWRHAVRAGALAQTLAAASNTEPRIGLGSAYLAGLLHDTGFLLMAQLAPGEYKLLNKMMASKPSLTTIDAEQRVFGVSHTWLAERLFKDWNLPEELIVAAAYHHDPAYAGSQCAYSRLIWLTARLLRPKGMVNRAGVANWDDLPQELMDQLGLEPEVLDDCLAMLSDKSEDLDSFASYIAA